MSLVLLVTADYFYIHMHSWITVAVDPNLTLVNSLYQLIHITSLKLVSAIFYQIFIF